MTPEIIAVFLVTWGAIGSLFVVIWNHVTKCNERQQQMGELIEAVRDIRKEIGGRESGLVRSLHDFKSEVRTAITALRHGDGR